MTVINGIGSPGPVRPGVRRTGAGGFQLPAEPAEAPCSPVSVMLATLLAVQEAGQEAAQDAGQAAVQDREAERHGEALLTALAALQRALLGAPEQDPGADRLDRLAALVQALPPAADPRLAAVQRSLMLRVAVELARGQAATSV